MDYYRLLGLNQSATKEEIKEAFRNLAKQFHPDKHSASPKSVRDGATLRFKQASEAYEVLVDDRKRADYNLRYNSNNNHYRRQTNSSGGGPYGSGYGYSHHGSRNNSYTHNYSYRRGFASRFEMGLRRFFTARFLLLNVAFAGALTGGTVLFDISRDAIWKMRNPGKSFEEVMESIEKTKSAKEKA